MFAGQARSSTSIPSDNPLLQHQDLPSYSAIRAEHVLPSIEEMLTQNRIAIVAIVRHQKLNPSWDGLVLAMDELDVRPTNAWNPVNHLNAVCNSAQLRIAYEACLPLLSAYATELGQHYSLFEAYSALATSPGAAEFDRGGKPRCWTTSFATFA